MRKERSVFRCPLVELDVSGQVTVEGCGGRPLFKPTLPTLHRRYSHRKPHVRLEGGLNRQKSSKIKPGFIKVHLREGLAPTILMQLSIDFLLDR